MELIEKQIAAAFLTKGNAVPKYEYSVIKNGSTAQKQIFKFSTDKPEIPWRILARNALEYKALGEYEFIKTYKGVELERFSFKVEKIK